MLPADSLIIDIQGIQSTLHRERGIARYIAEQARALLEIEDHAIHSLVINPKLNLVGGLEPLVGSGKVKLNGDDGPLGRRLGDGPFVYYITSAFELGHPLRDIWPRYARRSDVATAVTLYDVIPLIFKDRYLTDPVLREKYLTRLELVRNADIVLTISESTAQDAANLLEIPRSRIVNIGTGIPAAFQPTSDRARVLEALQTMFPDLRADYVFYTGGIDFRKNMEGLLEGYAAMEPSLRRVHELVITCRMLPEEERALTDLSTRLGIRDDVLFTNYVDDEVLVKLYQAARLFVFPSLYEGFGLPLAEALACGTPVITSNQAAMPEIVADPDLHFDPWERDQIAAAITRALQSEGLRSRSAALRAHVIDTFTWSAVAKQTASALSDLWESRLSRPRRARAAPARRRLAVFTPMPPQASGIADYSARQIAELAHRVDVDVFVEGEPSNYRPVSDPRVRLLNHRSFTAWDELGIYEEVVYCMGNSEYHGYVYDALQRRSGVVLAHEVRFTGFYSWYAQQRRLGNEWFHYQLRTQHPESPGELGVEGRVSPEAAAAHGLYMASELIRRSTRFLVHSRYAAQIACLQLPGAAAKIGVVPFGISAPVEARRVPSREPIVTTFGMVDPAKKTDVFVQAAALVAEELPDARFGVVGEIDPHYEAELVALADALGLGARMQFTGRLDPPEFERWMGRTGCAVQLRSYSNGETSAAVADCLRHGLPTIVSGIGPNRELPGDTVVTLDEPASVEALSQAIVGVLQDRVGAARLAERARALVASSGFANAAAALLETLISTPDLYENGEAQAR